MKRRQFITFIGGAAAWSLAANAQPSSSPVIAFLSSRSPEEAAGHTQAFLDGLKAFGYVDGQNATIEYRWSRGRYDELPVLARELVALRPAVIIAGGGTPSARAAKAATHSIPIVSIVGTDPVTDGLVDSLHRPGGNLTGVAFMTGQLGGKRLEFLLQVVPKADVVALLTNPQGPDAGSQIPDVEAAAHALGRRFVVIRASTETELDRGFSTLVENGVGGLVVANDPFFDSRRDQLLALATDRRIPAIYHIREFPAAGGLMSYGASLVEAYRQLGIQAGRVLKGANVAELPVVRPTRFELVINLKSADALGLSVPPMLLAQADETVE